MAEISKSLQCKLTGSAADVRAFHAVVQRSPACCVDIGAQERHAEVKNGPSGGSAMAVLIGMSPEVKGKNFELASEKVTIGRNAANMIVLNHPTVSGRHCLISRVGKQYTITDLGSRNGTRVNSQEIREYTLRPKDLIQVGAIEFLFDADPSEIELPADATPAPEVVVAEGPATAPISFTSLSPFGPRTRDRGTAWYVVLTVAGVAALLALGWFLYSVFTAG